MKYWLIMLLFLNACSLPYSLRWPVDYSWLQELNLERAEQDSMINQMSFFGLLTPDDEDQLEVVLQYEVGHYLGSNVAAAESDHKAFNYHMEEREHIQNQVQVWLDTIKRRMKEAPVYKPEPPVKKQDL